MLLAPGWLRGSAGVAVAVAVLVALLVVTSAGDDDTGPALTGVDVTKIPELARQMLPVIDDVVSHQCPELPPVWVVAEVMAESSWNAHAWSTDANGGAAGLYQINQRNWVVAGGQPWGSGPNRPPPTSADIYQPETQLRVTIPWVCANLRAVGGHLRATGKPTSPLDGMLVCHIAGCGRVTGSATGVPRTGEAGCGRRCVELIGRYLDHIHRFVDRFSLPVAPPPSPLPPPAAPAPGSGGPATGDPGVLAAPAPAPGPLPGAVPAAAAVAPGDSPGVAGAAPVGMPAPGAVPVPDAVAARPPGATMTIGGITTAALPAAPAAFVGPRTGCLPPDPTSAGCLTAATRYGLSAEQAAFGAVRGGPVIAGAGCWDRHAWNPSSDHARGRACDLFPGHAGTFARGPALDNGWRVANWLRTNSAALRVSYLIWQGRYWDPRTGDQGGWGERYDGGGVYDVHDPTGGHYDHVHVSFAE